MPAKDQRILMEASATGRSTDKLAAIRAADPVSADGVGQSMLKALATDT